VACAQLNVEDVAEPILIEVKDQDTIGSNDPLGDCTLSLTELQPNQATELTLSLLNVSKGKLVIEATWCPLDS